MNDSLYLFCFILACLTSTTHSQELAQAATSATGIGNVGCTYFARLAEFCTDGKDTPISSLPAECLFYIWDEAEVSWDYDVHDKFYDIKSDGILDALIHAGKNVFLKYGYPSFFHWMVVLACNGADGLNARDEMVGLKAYLDKHKGVKGLVLKNLVPKTNYKGFPGLTDGLKTYIGVVREHFNEMKIGLTFRANLFMDYYTDSKLEWLNFEVLGSLVDLIVIDMAYFNTECTPNLKCSGFVPMTGNAKYTLEKLKGIIDKSKIPRDKLYYLVNIEPTGGNITENSICEYSYKEMCKYPKASKHWCADSTQTFYEKGVYARENGYGIIGDAVDTDDPNCLCKCKIPFPGFYALVDGFKGNAAPKPCPMYDRLII